jgi:signal transduction histidine kinase
MTSSSLTPLPPSTPPQAPPRRSGLARFVPASLRWRILGSLLLAVVLAVVAETVSHMAEESARLERDLASQGARVTDALRGEMQQTLDALEAEIDPADPRGGLGRVLSSGRVETRFLGTRARLRPGIVEVLKVLAPDGAILSSGHWPASFGALDPNVPLYRKAAGRDLQIVDEPTPEGSAPALERWGTSRSGAREMIVVAGRFLDAPALERMRARTGADLVALCKNDAGKGADTSASSRNVADSRCIAVGTRDVLQDIVRNGPFDPDADSIDDRLHLSAIDLGTHRLWVGLDRSAILAVRASILRRAVAVGIASIAFAMLLGTLLATRITRPIEQLAQAAGRLASGDLRARVPADVEGGGGEVDGLVQAFNQMAQDLEKKQTRLLQAERVSAWQEIARGLAHELKNPLTPILGAMDVVRKARKLDRPDFDAILEEQATAVVEEVMRLKELSDAFARFARLPDRKPEPLKMSEVVDHAVALYANHDGILVERRYDPELPLVEADKTQIGTVVTNLVKNAIEAMEKKGALTVTLKKARGAEGAELVELVVDDTGPGIAPEIADRLFTPYVTTKGSRGTGLGLALAHRIVVEHGGSIEAGRNERGGAALTVGLPVKASPPLPA